MKRIIFVVGVFLVFIIIFAWMSVAKDKHIYLGTSMGNPENYMGLVSEIEKERGTIYIHLVGNGGDYEGMIYLANTLRAHHTVMVVEGTVQSAHATLALMGDDIVVPEYGIFMWHLVSTTYMERELCKNAQGIDRGIPMQQKCEQDVKAMSDLYNKEIIKTVSRILNSEEMSRLMKGEEVYLSAQEVKNRLEMRNEQ